MMPRIRSTASTLRCSLPTCQPRTSRASWRPSPGLRKSADTAAVLRRHPAALVGEDLAGLDDRGEDLGVAGAAAEVSRQRLGRLLRAHRTSDRAQPGVGRHQDAGGTEATLRRHVLVEAVLQGVQVGAGQPLDRGHLAAVGLHGQRDAGADVPAVDLDRAGAAGSLVAALLGADEVESVPQHLQQGPVGRRCHLHLLAVDAHADEPGIGHAVLIPRAGDRGKCDTMAGCGGSWSFSRRSAPFRPAAGATTTAGAATAAAATAVRAAAMPDRPRRVARRPPWPTFPAPTTWSAAAHPTPAPPGRWPTRPTPAASSSSIADPTR